MSPDCEGFCSGQEAYLLLLLHVGEETPEFFANLRGFPGLPSMCCSAYAIRIWYVFLCVLHEHTKHPNYKPHVACCQANTGA